LKPGTTLSFDTVNGKVNVEVPSDINATIKADALNGSITNEFGLPVRKGKPVGRDLHGRIGTGEVQIRMSAVNGGLFIGRKKDGKSSNPVTNLLKNTDTEDDEDDDDTDEVSRVETGHASRVAQRNAQRVSRVAQREIDKSTKTTEKGLKDAAKSLEKISPELKELNLEIEPKIFEKAIVEGVKHSLPAIRMNQALWAVSPATVEQRTRSFEMKGTPKVSINGTECRIRVRGWDKPTVKYVLTESRSTKFEPMSVTENVTESSVALKVVDRGTGGLLNGERTVRLDVYVPRKSDVSVSTDKEIRVEGVTGKIDLSGEDESVSVRDSGGMLKLHAENGLVRVVGFKGSLEMETEAAEVYLEGDFDRIESCSSDANITLTLPSDRNASISTNNAIESEGLNIVRENDRTWRLGAGGPKYEFNFSDGRLIVRNQAVIETN
jgi:hypothetical protein